MDPGSGRIQTASSSPSSPFIRFPALKAKLSSVLDPTSMDLIEKYHNAFLEDKITRKELVQRVRQLAGDELLADIIIDHNMETVLEPRIRSLELEGSTGSPPASSTTLPPSPPASSTISLPASSTTLPPSPPASSTISLPASSTISSPASSTTSPPASSTISPQDSSSISSPASSTVSPQDSSSILSPASSTISSPASGEHN